MYAVNKMSVGGCHTVQWYYFIITLYFGCMLVCNWLVQFLFIKHHSLYKCILYFKVGICAVVYYNNNISLTHAQLQDFTYILMTFKYIFLKNLIFENFLCELSSR